VIRTSLLVFTILAGAGLQPPSPSPAQPPAQTSPTPQTPAMPQAPQPSATSQPPATPQPPATNGDRATTIMLLERIQQLAGDALKGESKSGKVLVDRAALDEIAAAASQIKTSLQR
jgi:hypothetical protein